MSGNSSCPSDCTQTSEAFSIFLSFSITKTLLLPLSVLVLYLGHQRWRRSTATTSHSDVFSYHMAAAELLYVCGNLVYLLGLRLRLYELMMAGLYVSALVFPAQTFFHVLTCVERYLAVVHPVTYMGLRQAGGVRIRNISIACVWLLSCAFNCLAFDSGLTIIALFCSLVLSLGVVSYCSVRVLCVLTRPGPGQVGGNRERVDQSKQRAFHTMGAILGVLWLWFGGVLACVALQGSQLLSHSANCAVMLSAVWFNLPSSLVSPLMFLHRAGKLLN